MKPLKFFNTIAVLSFMIFAASATLAFAWTEPTLSPPSGNVSAPINTGATSQTKSGALTVSGALTAGSLSMTHASNGGVLTFTPSNNAQTIVHDYNNGNTAGFGMNANGAGYCGALFHTGSAKVTWCNNGGLALGTYAATTNAPANTLIVNNIGVGTSTPAQLLSVEGVIYSGTGGFRFPDGTTQTTAAAGGTSQWTTAGSNIYYNTGSVGIGASSPGSALHVTGSNTYAGSGLLLGSAGVASGYLWTTDNLYIKPNTSQGNASGGIYIQNVSEATKFAFDTSTGNFGIGTVAPKAPIQAYSAVVTTTTQIPAASGTTPLNPMARFDNNRGEVLDIGGQWASPYGIWLQATDAGALGTYYPLLLNPNGGNVGIGTAAPSDKLNIAGGGLTINESSFSATGADQGRIVNFTDNGLTLMLNDDSTARDFTIMDPNGNYRYMAVTNAGHVVFQDAPEAGGNVGIGTAAPSGKLHISGDTTVDSELILEADTGNGTETLNPYITFKQDGDTNSAFIGMEGPAGTRSTGTSGNSLLIGSEDTGDVDVQFITSDRVRMTILQTNGNVGVGSTTPAQLLSVQGNALFSGNLRVAGITATGTVSLKTFTETISATGNSGASATIDFSLGSVNTITLTANTTLAFSNATAGQSVTIFLKQDATGSRTVTWPTMLWSAATAPTLTTTANKTDIVTVFYDGTSYYGFLGGTNY